MIARSAISAFSLGEYKLRSLAAILALLCVSVHPVSAQKIHQFYNNQAWTDQDLTGSTLGPAAAAASFLAGFPIGNDQHVYYAAGDRDVHQLYFNSQASQWVDQDLTKATSGPSASPGGWFSGFPIDSEQHVYYVALDQRVHQLFYNAGASLWVDQNLSSATGGPSAIPGGFIASFPTGTGPVTGGGASPHTLDQHVYYAADDQHIHQLYYNASANQWVDQDLSSATHGPNAPPACWISGFPIGPDQHVYYVADDQHVHQLFYNASANQWVDQDLTVVTSGPAVPERSFLSGFSIGPEQHVYYGASDQHLHQLYFDATASRWVDQDLTKVTGGPWVASGLWISGVAVSTDQHVLYVSGDSHVHQLFYSTSTSSWSDQDLTNLTGGPLAQSAGFLSSITIASDLHAYYAAYDQHVHELRFIASGPWADQDLTTSSSTQRGPLTAIGTWISAFPIGTDQHVYYPSLRNQPAIVYTEVLDGSLGFPTGSGPSPSPAGTLGSVSFGGTISSPAKLTFTMTGNAGNVVPFFAPRPCEPSCPKDGIHAGQGFENVATPNDTASVTIQNALTGTMLAQATFLPDAGIFVSADNANSAAGFGSCGALPTSATFPGAINAAYPYGMKISSATNLESNISISATGLDLSLVGLGGATGTCVPLCTANSACLGLPLLPTTQGPLVIFTDVFGDFGSFSALLATYNLGISPLSPALVGAPKSATSTVTITPAANYSGTIVLGCQVIGTTPVSGTGTPACLLSGNSVTANGAPVTETVTVTPSTQTPVGHYSVIVTAADTRGQASDNGAQAASIQVLPSGGTPASVVTLAALLAFWGCIHIYRVRRIARIRAESHPVRRAEPLRNGFRLSREFLYRASLVAGCVTITHYLKWDWLRFVTSEAVLRLSTGLGMATGRLSFDTIRVNGQSFRFVIACTFVDVLIGAVPLLWNLRHSIFRNTSLLFAVAGVLLSFNMMRLEIAQILFAGGVSWTIADGVVSGLAYFLVCLIILHMKSWNVPNAMTVCLQQYSPDVSM